jgi:hypothetical protein
MAEQLSLKISACFLNNTLVTMIKISSCQFISAHMGVVLLALLVFATKDQAQNAFK